MKEATAGEGEPALGKSLQRGLYKGLRSSVLLVKIVFPLYIAVNFLKDSGLLSGISGFFSPLMVHLGLPGEAALAILAGNLGNMYAALAVVGPLGLTVKQLTIVGLMLGLSHTLIIESAVFYRIGARPVPVAFFRFFLSIAAGLVLNLVMPG